VLAQNPTQSTSILDHVKQRASQGDQQAEMLVAMQQMQEMNQNFNTQYIIIQQQTQQETREFTALSNVMKLRHDNTRNILANLK
jgi:RecA/RadA recombinase